MEALLAMLSSDLRDQYDVTFSQRYAHHFPVVIEGCSFLMFHVLSIK